MAGKQPSEENSLTTKVNLTSLADSSSLGELDINSLIQRIPNGFSIGGYTFIHNKELFLKALNYPDQESIPIEKKIIAFNNPFTPSDHRGVGYTQMDSAKDVWDFINYCYRNGIPVNVFEVVVAHFSQKPKFDFDFQTREALIHEDALIDAFNEGLVQTLHKYGIDHQNGRYMMLKSHKADGSKRSYHVILPYKVRSNKHAKALYTEVLETLPADLKKVNADNKIIDSSVYSTWQCFRTYKATKKTDDNRPLEIDEEGCEWGLSRDPVEVFENSMITTTDRTIAIDFLLPEPPRIPVSRAVKKERASVVVKLLQDDFLKQFEHKGWKRDFYILKNTKGWDCPICGVRHDSENAYITLGNGMFKFHCRRAPGKSHALGYNNAISVSDLPVVNPTTLIPSQPSIQLALTVIKPMNVYDEYYFVDYLDEFTGRRFKVGENGWQIALAQLSRVIRVSGGLKQRYIIKYSKSEPFRTESVDIRKSYEEATFRQYKKDGGYTNHHILGPAYIKSPLFYTNICCVPYHPHQNPVPIHRSVNIFPGLIARKVELTEASQARIALYFDHVKKILCDNNEDMFNYYISYFTRMLRDLKRTNVAMVLFGEEGAGKTLPSEIIQKFCLGNPCTASVTLPSILGTFNGVIEGKLMILINEAAAGDGSSNFVEKFETIKTFITDNLVPIRKMRTDLYNVDNITSYLVCTNNISAIHISEQGRRWPITHASSARIEDRPYFQKMIAELDNQIFGNELYTWFNSDAVLPHQVDITIIPDTEARRRMQAISMPRDRDFSNCCFGPSSRDEPILVASDFFYSLHHKSLAISAKALYGHYKAFMEEYHTKGKLQDLRKFELVIDINNKYLSPSYERITVHGTSKRVKGFLLTQKAMTTCHFGRALNIHDTLRTGGIPFNAGVDITGFPLSDPEIQALIPHKSQ